MNLPIILACHSQDKALANASAHSADDFCRHLRQNARGFIFLGTPHRGARITLAGQILSLFGFWRGSSTSLLGIIKPGSAINQSMHDDFMRYLRGGGPGPTVESIVCVFEAVKESLWGWPIMHVSTMAPC